MTSGLGGGARAANLPSKAEALDVLDGLDSLDDFLDTIPAGSEAKPELGNVEKSLDDLLDELNPLESGCGPRGEVHQTGVKALNALDSLDALDSFPSAEGVGAEFSVGGAGLDALSDFGSTGDYIYLSVLILFFLLIFSVEPLVKAHCFQMKNICLFAHTLNCLCPYT